MASYYGKNANLIVNNRKAATGEVNGHRKTHFEEITLKVGTTYNVNDYFVIGALLPIGARVLEAVVKGPNIGATGIVQVGYLASNDGKEVADLDGFIDGATADFGGQGNQIQGVGLAIGKKFTAQVQPVMVFTEASPSIAATDKVIQCWIEFIVD